MSRIALFRCDASPQIGAGHVMRCLALAEAMLDVGYEPVFLSSTDTVACTPALARTGLRIVSTTPGSNGVAEARAAGIDCSRVAVIDHYGLMAADEQDMAGIAGTVVVCEDLPIRRHAADILIDPTPGRRAADYIPLVDGTALHLGPPYALIRRPWRDARKAEIDSPVQRAEPLRIVVSMGATDPKDAASRVLTALARAEIDCDVDVVLGAAAPHLERVRALCSSRARLHVEPADMPTLVAGASLAIGAPGSSSFERAMLGVPSLVIPVADNQRDIAAALAATGAAYVVDAALLDDPSSLGAIVRNLLRDHTQRAELSKAAFGLCDGRGASRLLTTLAGEIEGRDGGHIKLRLAETSDCDWLFALQIRPETRAFSRNPAAPARDEHVRWFTRTLADPDRFLMIIERAGRACGFVRLDRSTNGVTAAPTYEISIAVEPEQHGSGVGRAALALARRMAPGAIINATVLSANAASKALFLGSGYAQVSVDLYQCRPQ